MIHYYGALAPRSPLRQLLVAKAVKETDRIALREKVNKLKKKAKSWAACLARVFEVFPLICPLCRYRHNGQIEDLSFLVAEHGLMAQGSAAAAGAVLEGMDGDKIRLVCGEQGTARMSVLPAGIESALFTQALGVGFRVAVG